MRFVGYVVKGSLVLSLIVSSANSVLAISPAEHLRLHFEYVNNSGLCHVRGLTADQAKGRFLNASLYWGSMIESGAGMVGSIAGVAGAFGAWAPGAAALEIASILTILDGLGRAYVYELLDSYTYDRVTYQCSPGGFGIDDFIFSLSWHNVSPSDPQGPGDVLTRLGREIHSEGFTESAFKALVIEEVGAAPDQFVAELSESIAGYRSRNEITPLLDSKLVELEKSLEAYTNRHAD